MAGGLLTAREIVGLGRASAEALAAADAEDGLRRVAATLVPAVADRATLFVVDPDGRLHSRIALGEGHDGDAGSGADRSISLDSSHVAARACREHALTFVEAGGDDVRVLGNGGAPDEGRRVQAVALPLQRAGETVGALHLQLEGDRRYAGHDLEYLDDFSRRLSQTLENHRLRREVKEARRAKSDFLAVMSHELRTPLTAVVGYADLLEAGIPGEVNERQIRHLIRIKESAWQLLELIDGILGYARYEGEDPELRVELVRPEELVEDALRTQRGNLREKGLELAVDMEDGLPILHTDREKAMRILFHLLSNAAKFTDDGEVVVSVSADRDWVRFRVADTGPGISESEMEQIFEPFWQGERVETRTKGGTGMGLSLARRLAELVTGRIEVESRVGDGSAFTLLLPRQGPHPSFS